MTEIVVLVPVYQRPHRVQPLLDSFHSTNPNATLLFIVSPEDTDERDALRHTNHLVHLYHRGPGDWARKINYGYKHTTAPWILCAADDIKFHKGWDTHLLRAAARTRKHVLGTNDLNPNHNPANIYSPHPMVHRSYADRGTVDRDHQVVCEKYNHNYPDRELAATAIARDEWFYVRGAILEHLHPGWTETEHDNTYRLGELRAQPDYRLYLRRHRLWDKERRNRLGKKH